MLSARENYCPDQVTFSGAEPSHPTTLPINDKDYLLIDNESDSTSDSDTDSLFDNSNNKANTVSDTNLDSLLEEVNSNTNNNDDLFNDEVRHLLKYYFAALANLDVGRLWQKRYSLKTQGRLNWVKDYYNQYELNVD
jgi:hypothetical protein